MNLITDTFNPLLKTGSMIIYTFLPKFVAGIIIIFIGLVVASLIKDLIKIIFNYFRIEKWLETAGIVREEDVKIWPSLLSELARWTIIFVFLNSAVDTWGVPKVGDLLNQLLLFLPNVFVAVIIGWIGLITAKLASDIVRHSLKALGEREALILGQVARYAIVFFTILIILTQLGVAAELVKILFTGIVSMLALSFGLAFGLGGQEEAQSVLKKIREKIESSSSVAQRKK